MDLLKQESHQPVWTLRYAFDDRYECGNAGQDLGYGTGTGAGAAADDGVSSTHSGKPASAGCICLAA